MRTLGFPYPSNPATFVVIVTLAHDVLGQKLYQRSVPNVQSFHFAKIQQLFLTLGSPGIILSKAAFTLDARERCPSTVLSGR